MNSKSSLPLRALDTLATCGACGVKEMSIFYTVNPVPVHSVLLMPTREAALNYPTGKIELGFCARCGFISNTAFDPRLLEYSAAYEETQSFSKTFNSFHRQLASRLIDRHALHGKRIVEIGCGKGEFLALLCELGGNHGIGFDPSYVEGRCPAPAGSSLEYVTDFYSDKYTEYHADFICCKMTLEHIHTPADFLMTVRRSIGDRKTVVFFQVPDARRIFTELAFWDIYYEHCSYFDSGSLSRLFRSCGFELLEVQNEYSGQYLTIEAYPNAARGSHEWTAEAPPDQLWSHIMRFSTDCRQKFQQWRKYLRKLNLAGRRVVLWGGGSKAVAFLTTMGITREIEYAVDIDPFKHWTFIAGTGQQIVAPEFLVTYRPDVVIVMNPVYREEVRRSLEEMGLNPLLLTVEDNRQRFQMKQS